MSKTPASKAPPTEEKRDLYAKLGLAYGAVLATARSLIGRDGEAKYGERAKPEHFERMTAAFRAYADLILECCPASADRTAALRCLRLARNAVNDILCGAKDFPHGFDQSPFHAIFEQELTKARYQANASIALDGRG